MNWQDYIYILERSPGLRDREHTAVGEGGHKVDRAGGSDPRDSKSKGWHGDKGGESC